MKRSGPEVEAAFRRERGRDFLSDLRHGWWVAAIVLGLLAFSIVNDSMPRRSLGIEEAVAVGARFAETEAGTLPYADVRLSSGTIQTVRVPRGVVLQNGARVRVEAYEGSWPWTRLTYRYVALAKDEQ